MTSDSHILDADPIALSLAFEDAGLCVVKAAHPARLSKLYKKSGQLHNLWTVPILAEPLSRIVTSPLVSHEQNVVACS